MVDLNKFVEQVTATVGQFLKRDQKKEEKSITLSPATVEDVAEVQVNIGGGAISNEEIEQLKKDIANATGRVSEVETSMQKLEEKMNKLVKATEENKSRIEELDSRILEMMSIYEVVSNQMNPFVGANEGNKGIVEELRKEIDALKQRSAALERDLSLVIKSRINISKLVKTAVEAKVEEERTKTDLGKLIKTTIVEEKK